jgi:hypothetical protein
LRLRSILTGVDDLITIPINYLRKVDPLLLTLFDIDSEKELKKAETYLKKIGIPVLDK